MCICLRLLATVCLTLGLSCYSVKALEGCPAPQDDCEALTAAEAFDPILMRSLAQLEEESVDVNISITDFQVVCETAGFRRGRALQASVLAGFTCASDNPAVCPPSSEAGLQFDAQCISESSEWEIVGQFAPEAGLDFNSHTLYCDVCLRQLDMASPASHCSMACELQCSDGLQRCTSPQPETCCNFYYDDDGDRSNDLCCLECPQELVSDQTFDCGCPPLVLDNGGVTYSNPRADSSAHYINTAATFSCNPGFVLENDVSRTCLPNGWNGANSTVCIEFDLGAALETLANTNTTEENYVTVVTELNSLISLSVVAVEEQTKENLNRSATVFNNVASLVPTTSTLTIIVDNAILALVETLNSLLQWNPEVLAVNGSDIIEDFEDITAFVAGRIIVVTPDVVFVAENLDVDVLETNGRSFVSADSDGVPDPQTGDSMIPDSLAPSQTAFIDLPPSLFESVPEDRTNVVLLFALYGNPSLFPVAEAQVENSSRVITVLSPVIAASVGPQLTFVDLASPVTVLLRLQDIGENQTISFGSERCVSWDFEANGGEGNWTTEGCETIGLVDGVVTCQCNHLTNFAILVDICSRVNGSDCTLPPALEKALEVLTVIGVSLSLFGLVITIITLLAFKRLRDRDATKYHVQLCIAMICMLLVFVAGINRTAVYGGCVLVSVLIHYFTLVAVLWMAAEALLMFQKLVIVFVTITTKFIVIVSILCWDFQCNDKIFRYFTASKIVTLLAIVEMVTYMGFFYILAKSIPIIPVIIPLIVDLTTRPEQDIVVNRDQFCFLKHPGAFFGAFLVPIFALLVFNVVIFICVIVVLVRHTKGNAKRQKEGMKKGTAVRLLISICCITFLFGLTWLFGALTITVAAVNLLSQILFVIFSSLQGFFIFLFFCVFNKEARESWKEVLSCGRYKSEFLHHPNAKFENTGNRNKKLATASTDLDAPSSAAKSNSDSKNTLNGSSKYSEIPMDIISEISDETKTNLSAENACLPAIAMNTSQTEKDTNVDTNKETSTAKNDGNGTTANGGIDSLKPLNARLKRYSTKKAREHQVEVMEIDFSDSDDSGDSVDLSVIV